MIISVLKSDAQHVMRELIAAIINIYRLGTENLPENYIEDQEDPREGVVMCHHCQPKEKH